MKETIYLCPFCSDSPDEPISDIDIQLHEKFGIHKTGNTSWQPSNGHSAYEAHRKLKDLFNHISQTENRAIKAENKLKDFLAFPWYKRIILVFNPNFIK